jgi:hypothetical protein
MEMVQNTQRLSYVLDKAETSEYLRYSPAITQQIFLVFCQGNKTQ